MEKVTKRKYKMGRIVIAVPILVVVVYLLVTGSTKVVKNIVTPDVDMFLAADSYNVKLYNEEFTEVKELVRGTKGTVNKKAELTDPSNVKYYKIKISNENYYVKTNNLVLQANEVAKETKIYVRTPATLLEDLDSGKIAGLGKKGAELAVIGYDGINADGSVKNYKIRLENIEGYIAGKYTSLDQAESLLNYNPTIYDPIHSKKNNVYGGGSAINLDYYPVVKPELENNKMPDPVYSLYLNCGKNVIGNVDAYIEYAKTTKINTFVVDIKDNQTPGYKSKVMETLSPTNYQNAINTYDEYKSAITKIKAAGFYVIGRITVFKDKYYITDHPENAMINASTGAPYLYSGTYWPSPYLRDVWYFNVELAKEAVLEMGFNEIQFDYVRFPDRTQTLEKDKVISFPNPYGEEKAQAIQRFLMYAADELHKVNAYISADVFGESANGYVTAYGQYWPAITNVVDVISGMPYPDHFNVNEYGFTTPVYKIPYDLLNYWGKNYVMKRQAEAPTPAKVRTWIQAYDALPGDFPYNAPEVELEIRGLFDAGLNNGYITWLSSSNLEKYKSQKAAYSKTYKEE